MQRGNMADLWSDYSDVVISNADAALGNKYKIKIRDFLAAPMRYAGQTNIVTTAQNMKEDLDKYIDKIYDGLKDERTDFNDAASKADSVTSQLAQNISLQAKQNRVPIITPAQIVREESNDEVIYVDKVDSGVFSMIEKLVLSSTYIADTTSKYGSYSIGEWLFSGSKNYVLRAYLPDSPILTIDASKEELDQIFDNAISIIK